ncbi:hypothetical protein PENTCL1PPCAC_17096, partial [Pristionchus entomophagus]
PPSLFSLRSHRLKIGLMLMFGLAVCACMRTNLNMAVVCMVNATAYRAQLSAAPASTVETEGQCSRIEETSTARGYNGTLEWTPQMQASLLTATFYGSLITITFSGSIADRFGPTLIFSGAVIVYVIVNMATPFLAEFSFRAYFAARVIMGIAEGFVFPCIGSMAGRWFPPLERSTMAGIYTSGNQIGSSLSSVISAALCASPLGWQSIFYLFGALGVVWIMGWLTIASNSPASNRFITDREAKFLESEIRRKEASKSIPWRSLLKSKPVYACLCCQFAFSFSGTLLQAYLPTYFRDELMIPLSMNGFYTTIPFAVQIFMKSFCSIVADALKRKGILKPTTSSKVFQTLCALGIASSMISLAFLPSCDTPWIAAICLAFYGISFSFGIPGYFSALLSVAPQYSGTLTSMTMLSGTLANISSPMLTSLLMTLKTQSIWKVVFSVTGVLNLIGGIIFLIFGDAEVQEWAITNDKQPSVECAEERSRSRIEEEKTEIIHVEFSCGSEKSI